MVRRFTLYLKNAGIVGSMQDCIYKYSSMFWIKNLQYMLFENKIKELRDEQGLLQRQLAAFLEIDTPMFSKIERGDRRAKREQVIKLAEYLHQDEKERHTWWLADKFIDAVDDEQERDVGNEAIIVAQEKIKTM